MDEEAAAVVRRIFRLAVEGHGPYEISKMLTAEKVECPGYYLAKQRAKQKKQGKKSGTSMLDKNRPYDWYGNTVSTLLERPEYMGHTVNFRSSKKSYRDKRVKNAPEDWLIFENTHEAIVDPETWQLAQQVKRTVRRTDTTGVANPFTGLVFCADCGAKMYNHRGRHTRSDGKEYSSDTYNCSTYCLTIERETKQCFSHSVSTKALTELVLETIRTTASYAIQNKEEFIRKVRSISQVRQQEAAKELKRKVAKAKKRIAELDMLIKKLYETYAMGKLEEKRFEMLSAEYEKEQDELEQTLASDQASLDQFKRGHRPRRQVPGSDEKVHGFFRADRADDQRVCGENCGSRARPPAPDAAPGASGLKFISSSSANLTYPCRSRPRKNWPQRKSAARSAYVITKSICGRRNARKRLPRDRSFRVSRMRWCASAAERPSTPSAPTLNSVHPPADSGSTASKNENFRRRMQYPSRNLWKTNKTA